MKVDNFALTMFQACPLKYFTRIKEGWTTQRKSAALGFGGSLHEGLATWYRTHDKAKALMAIDESWPDEMPVDDWRTKTKCIQVMLDYMKMYPAEAFQVVGGLENPMIECTFTLETGLWLNCETCEDRFLPDSNGLCAVCTAQREPIEYGGIFDGLVEWSGQVYVFEHKTTSMFTKYYFNQFKPNNQVTGYVWAAGAMSGRRVGGAIVNAIGMYKASATKFERQITTRSDADIKRWLTNVQATCQQIRDCELRGYWPEYTQSCTMYGLCEFHRVHELGTDRERQALLEMDFTQDPWHFEQRAGLKGEVSSE